MTEGRNFLNTRKKELGTANSIGAKVTALRIAKKMQQKELLQKLQLCGIEISSTGLSKLEGQTRAVKAEELAALMDIFSVPIEYFYPKDE